VQKPNFSVAVAFSAGVELIEQSFGSVLAWSAATFVLTLVPAAAAFFLLGGRLVLPDGGVDLVGVKSLESGLALEQRPQSLVVLLLLALLALIWLVVETAVIYAAIYRTALARKSGRFANLRLGPSEGWLSLLIVVQIIGLVILVLACRGGVFAVTLAAMNAGPPADRWILGIGWGAIFALALWLVLRLGLSQVMTVADGRFRLFESWGLTRGRAWKLFWTLGLFSSLIMGLEVFYANMMAYGIEIIFGVPVTAANLAAADLVPIPGFAVPVGLLWLAFVSFTGILIRVLLLAPLASAYRGLTGSS
jgi:hypothetical protein